MVNSKRSEESETSSSLNPSVSSQSPKTALNLLSSTEDTSKLRQLETNKSDPSCNGKLIYNLNESPGIWLSLLLGLQNYIIMLGGTIAYPYILGPKMCIDKYDPARGYLISTSLFCSGISSMVQTYLGVRLPIIQGPSFTFLVPAVAILSLPVWQCPNTSQNATSEHASADEISHIWTLRMREIQGAVIVASLVEVTIGAMGILGHLLRFITPLSIVPTISLIGLSLFKEATEAAGQSWLVSGVTICLVVLFSQYLVDYELPLMIYSCEEHKFHVKRFKIFAIIPLLLAIVISYILCWILTMSNFYPKDHAARTDNEVHRVVGGSFLIRIPYPFQWGLPSVTFSAVLGMTSGVLASAIGAVGDYYAAARLCNVPLPPNHAINRGIFVEGLSCVLAGIMGSGGGLTSYSENIGAIGITRTASRQVVAAASLLMITLSIFTKISAIFASLPMPIIGGLLMPMFGMCTAIGLSYLQFIDLKSPRNLFILGSSLFFGLSIPSWMIDHKDSIKTGSLAFDQLIHVLLSTGMFVGGLIGVILDNTVPGTDDERGINKLLKFRADEQSKDELTVDESTHSCYELPTKFNDFFKRHPWMKSLPISPTFVESNLEDKSTAENDQPTRVTVAKSATDFEKTSLN